MVHVIKTNRSLTGFGFDLEIELIKRSDTKGKPDLPLFSQSS